VATVPEVPLSCRILGREVETTALARFAQWLEDRGIRRIRFAIAEGPRNQPARDWLRRFVPDATEVDLAELKRKLFVACRDHAFTIREHIDDRTVRKAV